MTRARFGNVYKSSSLEIVVGFIAGQRQIFKDLPNGELERYHEQIAPFDGRVKAIRAVSTLLTPVHVV